jgi:hypothetical protein
MCSPALTLRNILEGQGDADAYKELLKSLEKFRFLPDRQRYEMRRQFQRLQDLSERGVGLRGGGFGFTVELFFLALSQLLSTSSSKESHSALYTGTFRAITSDWREHKYSDGTQNLLLDIAMSRHVEFERDYPAYIVDEFLLLLENIFAGQTGPRIDEARQRVRRFLFYGSLTGFKERVSRIFTSGQAQSLVS